MTQSTFARIAGPVCLGAIAIGTFAALTVPLRAERPREELSMAGRVACHAAIEKVYWRHRTWPAENAQPRPRFEDVFTEATLRRQALDSVRMSAALDRLWNVQLTPAMLQAELDRMQRASRAPRVLREIFDALGQSPLLIAECLVRPQLAQSRLRQLFEDDERVHGAQHPEIEPPVAEHESASDAIAPSRELELLPERPRESFEHWWDDVGPGFSDDTIAATPVSLMFQSPGAPCADDSWRLTNYVPEFAGAVSFWTGAEMIVWNGQGARYNPATDTWRPMDRRGPAQGLAVWSGSELIVWSPGAAGARYNLASDTWTTLPTSGAPSVRRGAAAVWTGTEMIVWGGSSAVGNTFNIVPLDDGARYNPATNTWTAMSGVNAPDPRAYHAIVWTGSRAVIWGGDIATFTPTDTGGMYDPATNTWTATTTVNAPVLYSPRAVWAGGRMIVWDGSTGGRFDPLANTWSSMATLDAPSERSNFASVSTGTELVIWGGYNGDDGHLDSGARYSPATNVWTPLPSVNAPSAREWLTAVWTGSDIILWGGFSYDDQLASRSGGRLNLASGAWTPIAAPAIPTPRLDHAAVWTGAEMIIWGGMDDTGHGLATGGMYRPATDSWMPMSTQAAPAGRHRHKAVWTGTEMVVFGGQEGGHLGVGGRFNPVTNQWRSMSATGAPSPRTAFAMVWTGNRVVVWGGMLTPFPPLLGANDGGLYDPIADSWSPTSVTGAPSARWNPAFVWTGSRLIVWGNTGDGSGGRYDPATNSWQSMNTVNAPALRVGPVAVWSGTEMIVWGGSFVSDGSGGRYNPTTNSWTSTSLAGAPVPRASSTGAWNGTQMIVWTTGTHNGGVGARYTPSTNSWQPIAITSKAPVELTNYASVWTGSELVIWGGGFWPGDTGATRVDWGAAYCGLAADVPPLPDPPSIAVAPLALRFGAVGTGAGGPLGSFVAVTGAQTVRISQTGIGTVNWTATSDRLWLGVSSASGTGPASLAITATPTPPGVPLGGTITGNVTLTFSGAYSAIVTIPVTLVSVLQGSSAPPFGSFDTPANGSTGVTGSVALTGWALDDLDVTRVRIVRTPVPGPCSPAAAASWIPIGTASLVDGARPDVAGLNPNVPRNTRAGWGYMMLSNFLPGLGNGTFTFCAIADDAEGRSTVLGEKTLTFNNSSATKPFGAIDTPGQGQVISGTSFFNFGWVLAHGPDRADPPSGGSVTVFIDSLPVGTPDGWTSRSDLTALFSENAYPGIAKAAGVFTMNPAAIGEGVHTIAWIVRDNNNDADGIGSRYFTVAGAAGTAVRTAVPPAALRPLPVVDGAVPLASHVDKAPQPASLLRARRGFDLATPFTAVAADVSGRHTIDAEELDRIEVQLEPGEGALVAYMRVGQELGPLPIGSHLDEATATFGWQPGVGFIGRYDLVFVRTSAGRVMSRQEVTITLHPRGNTRVGPQVTIDTPTPDTVVSDFSAPLTIAGWALDLDDPVATGVTTVHAWAYPIDALTGSRLEPRFLNVASYGGERPDVAASFGARFRQSGYGLTVEHLEPGVYDLAVFAWSSVRRDFVPATVVRITVR